MHKSFRRVIIAFLFFSASRLSAQISVSGGSGLAATYTSLTNAGGLFAAINATSQSGNSIVVSITADMTSEDGSNSLNAGAWTSITISPSGGASRTISGAPAAGTPLINFNGADNVTIDGLNTGGNALIISNTTISAIAGTSAIRFIADATSNTIRNCTISGSATSTTSGTVFFSTGTATGNDNNTITACTIKDAGGSLPINAIYSAGSSTIADNSGITISNNNIQDYFNAAAASNGIYIASNSASWTITGNKFFQSATRTFTAGVTARAINIITASGGGYAINNNIIGYANSSSTGTTTYDGIGVNGAFYGIEITAALTPVSNLQGNTITAISLTTLGTTTTAPGVFSGMSILGALQAVFIKIKFMIYRATMPLLQQMEF